jgi:tetratricopeptide (TPR) repeat protein
LYGKNKFSKSIDIFIFVQNIAKLGIQQLALDNDSNKSSNITSDVKKALVIAVSDYDDLSGLKSIEFCKNDGQEMYNVLKENGYDIPDNRKLIGHVDSLQLKKIVYNFFTDESNQPDDTIVFYYSGHGVPDRFGKTFLAPSDMDSEHPFMTGFSFEDLTDAMLACNSLRVVTILDSCFSGSLKIGKGLGAGLDSKSSEEAAARIDNSIVEEKADKLKQGVGRCLLASSQGYEEAYDRKEKDHSVFTYYLLEGLKGHKNAVDDEGNVTYDALGKFIAREMGSLPLEKRPKQTPVRKGEVSGGEIILTSYPDLKKKKEPDFYSLFGRAEHYYRLRRYKEALESYDSIIRNEPENEYALLRKGLISLQVNDYTTVSECFEKIIKLNPNNSDAWYYKAKLNIKEKNYEGAIECLDKASDINPDDEKIWKTYRKVKSLMRGPTVEDDYGGTRDLGKEQEKLTAHNKETQSNPILDDIDYFCNMGFDLYVQDKYDEAIEWYDKALKIRPDYLKALKGRQLSVEKLGNYQSGAHEYKEDRHSQHQYQYKDASLNTVLFPVTIKTKSLHNNQGEAIEWAHNISNYNADMIVKDIKVLGDAISFEIGFEGMDDAQPIDIKTRLDEYIEMDDMLQVTNMTIVHSNKKYKYDLKKYNIDKETVAKMQTKAESLRMLDKYDEAIKYFDKVLAIDPNYNLARAQRTKAINSNENLNNKKKDFWKR